MLGSPEGSNLVPQLVLALSQLDLQRAMEVSRESSVTEGFLASGMEKQKGWTMGARLARRPGPKDISVGWSFCLLGGLGGRWIVGSFPSAETQIVQKLEGSLLLHFSFSRVSVTRPPQAL